MAYLFERALLNFLVYASQDNYGRFGLPTSDCCQCDTSSVSACISTSCLSVGPQSTRTQSRKFNIGTALGLERSYLLVVKSLAPSLFKPRRVSAEFKTVSMGFHELPASGAYGLMEI